MLERDRLWTPARPVSRALFLCSQMTCLAMCAAFSTWPSLEGPSLLIILLKKNQSNTQMICDYQGKIHFFHHLDSRERSKAEGRVFTCVLSPPPSPRRQAYPGGWEATTSLPPPPTKELGSIASFRGCALQTLTDHLRGAGPGLGAKGTGMMRCYLCPHGCPHRCPHRVV